MTEPKVIIDRISTGIPGLDRVLGGGLPEYSFNLIAGPPGAGKTTLSQQIMFANASPDRHVIHFTVLGEPPLKMLRYQQQFDFFDASKIETLIRYRNLSEEVLSGDLNRVLDSIVREVERSSPEIVVVDSFRTVVRAAASGEESPVQKFLQQLSLHLASWEATSFLIGEYQEAEVVDNPVFTVADGILWLHQQTERNSVVRKLQAVKVRGQAPMPGLHTFRITSSGLKIFPRTDIQLSAENIQRPEGRISTGVPGFDAMLAGGFLPGDSVLLAGPSGSGKTVLGTHFVTAGAAAGERAVIAVFEENPESYVDRAQSFGHDLSGMEARGDLRIIYLRTLDLSADEALLEIQAAVQEMGATRVVIDSLSGFEIALAQSFRDEFRESLYRMVAALSRAGVTIFMTVEVTDDYTALRFSPHAISFLTDDIILQRYIEMEGKLERVMTVVKMRGSGHSKQWRLFNITPAGLQVGESLEEYRGIISGLPVRREDTMGRRGGLSDSEGEVLKSLEDLGRATVDQLAAETGIEEAELDRILLHLARLSHVFGERRAGMVEYRVAARSLMP